MAGPSRYLGRFARQVASGLLFALLASVLVTAGSIAQEAAPAPVDPAPPAPADPAAGGATPPADTAVPPADPAPTEGDPAPPEDAPVPPEGAPAPTEPDPPAPANPAPAQDDPPEIVGIGAEVTPAPATPPPPTPAPEPGADAGAPAPDEDDADDPPVVKEPSAEPSMAPAAAAAVGDTISARRVVPQGVFGSWAKADFFTDNACASSGPTSPECERLLYSAICIAPGEAGSEFGGRYYDEAFCAAALAGNPCTRDPRSDDCRLILNNSCFDPDTTSETKCYHIRNALFEPGNPCREQGPDSPACASFASEQRCQERALTGEDCELYLLFLRGFTLEQEAACLDAFRDQGPAAAAQTSRACGLYVSLVLDACTYIYPPLYGGCGPLGFGGADESEGFEGAGDGGGDGDGGDDGEGPIGGPGAGGDDGFESEIFDPGRGEDLDPAGPVSDEGGDDGRRRRSRARALPRTGSDLGGALVLSLVLTAGGFGLHRMVRRHERREAAR